MRLRPLADLFMGLMWSRPGGLSLRTTWVTPATIWLGIAIVVGIGLPGFVAVGIGAISANLLLVAAGLLALALSLGSGIVAVYGIRQRLLQRAG
jgi:hypothetical protein